LLLNEDAMAVLEARPAEQRCPYVFYSPETRGVFLRLKTVLKGALRRAGLSGITWHTLRADVRFTADSQWRRPRNGQGLLGRAEIKTKLRYAHSNAQAKACAVAQVAAT